MESQQTHTQTTSAFHVEVNIDYLRTIPGILKIVQLVLSIIAFGCSVGSHRSDLGWVNFVAITGFIHAVFYLLIHLILVFHSKWTIIIELVIYAVWTLLFLIAGIVAAAMARGDGSAGAAAAFSFFAMVAWGIDAALQARNVSITWTSSSSSATATTTTSTTTTSNTASNPTPSPPKYDEVQY